MTTPKWSISPHFDQPHTRLDQLAILANVRITRDRLRIPCPAHGGTNPNLELKVASDRLSAVCFSQGCSYREIAPGHRGQVRDLHRRAITRKRNRSPTPGPGLQHHPGVPRTSGPMPCNSGAAPFPSPGPPTILPGSGSPPAICGAQSFLSPGQYAGSAPYTSTGASREPELSLPWRHSRPHGPRPGPICQS